jgi:hypothetical protein
MHAPKYTLESPPPPPTSQSTSGMMTPSLAGRRRLFISSSTILALIIIAGSYYAYWNYQSGLLPDETSVRQKLNAVIFSYLELKDFRMTNLGSGTIDFTGTISPSQDLYYDEEILPDLSGIPSDLTGNGYPPPPNPVSVLHLTNKKGSEIPIYGGVVARKDSEGKWIVDGVRFDSDLNHLGNPKDSFPPDGVIADTEAAQNAVSNLRKHTTAYAQDVRRVVAQERAATLQQQQLALENKRKADAQTEAAKVEILSTVKAGDTFQGTLTFQNGETQEIVLRFTDISNLLVKVEASNPARQGIRQTFAGSFVPALAGGSDYYPISLSPAGYQSPPLGWFFYDIGSGILKLRLTKTGIEGTATINQIPSPVAYTLAAQRETPAQPASNTAAASASMPSATPAPSPSTAEAAPANPALSSRRSKIRSSSHVITKPVRSCRAFNARLTLNTRSVPQPLFSTAKSMCQCGRSGKRKPGPAAMSM